MLFQAGTEPATRYAGCPAMATVQSNINTQSRPHF